MTTLIGIFAADAFSTVSLTDAVNKIPHQPTFIESLGLFKTVPIKDRVAAIEDLQGTLTVLPTVHRNGPAIPSNLSKRTVRQVAVPCWKSSDTVFADDVIGVRAFGSNETMSGVEEVIGRKMDAMSRSMDATTELCRLTAVTTGIVNYAANSVDSDLNLYTLFGTSQQTEDFALSVTTTAVLGGRLPEVSDDIESALGGEPFSEILVICGRTFFRAFVNHPDVIEKYGLFNSMYQTQPISMAQPWRRQFVHGPFRFVEYYGSVGGVTYIDTDKAYAIPVGPDIYKTIVAPAPLIEATGTMGQPKYMRQWVSPDGQQVNLELHANQLHYVSRPRAIIEMTKS